MATRKRGRTPENLTFSTSDTARQQEPPAQAGKKWRKKRRWWQCGPVKCFLLAIAAIFVLNFASLKREEKVLMPKGDRYDIGWGQYLFMRCTGSGTPVIILDAPIGETSDIWINIEPLLSKHTKVCVYDRAGLGFSDRAYKNTSSYAQDFSKEAKRRDLLMPGTIERMVDDLHRLIDKTIGTSPLILVGVDYSTLIARFYAQFYESDVVGLILIDPLVETLFDNNSTWNHHWYKEVLLHVNVLYLSASLGLNRIALLTGLMKPVSDNRIIKVVSEDFIQRKKYLMCHSGHISSVMDEIYLTNMSLSQVKTIFKVKPFPQTLPITMATYQDTSKELNGELIALWREAQDVMIQTVHPQVKRSVIPGDDTDTLYLHPQALISLIITNINQWRKSS